jgi:hypothetical protein
MSRLENFKFALLLSGITATTIAILLFRTVFTFEFMLAPIKGTINNATTYITTETSRSRYGQERKGQKSELIFHLRGKTTQFQLRRNIGNAFIDEEYESILKELKLAHNVTVWVRKSELDETEPEIFQIEADNTIILPHETVRTENFFPAFLLLVFGLGALTTFSFISFPDRMRTLFKISRSASK